MCIVDYHRVWRLFPYRVRDLLAVVVYQEKSAALQGQRTQDEGLPRARRAKEKAVALRVSK